MKRDKVFTETAKQLIDEENKNVVGKRPRGRPKKIQGSGVVGEFIYKTFHPQKYAIFKEHEKLAIDRMMANKKQGSGLVDYL